MVLQMDLIMMLVIICVVLWLCCCTAGDSLFFEGMSLRS